MARDSAYARLAFKILGEMSAIILLPALLALAGARVLAAQNVSRSVQLGLCAIAFALTAVLLVRRARSYGREFERMTKEPL